MCRIFGGSFQFQVICKLISEKQLSTASFLFSDKQSLSWPTKLHCISARENTVGYKSPFQLTELASQIGQSVNRMRYFEGMLLQNLEK